MVKKQKKNNRKFEGQYTKLMFIGCNRLSLICVVEQIVRAVNPVESLSYRFRVSYWHSYKRYFLSLLHVILY